MKRLSHLISLCLPLMAVLAVPVVGQQPAPPTSPATAPAGQPAAVPSARDPFNIPPAEQAYIDEVLRKWEADSATIQNFYCDFERDRHQIFGPNNGKPTRYEKGKLGYTRPDKGSFQITEMLVWTPSPQAAPQPIENPQEPPQAPPAKGEWKKPLDTNGKEEPGEHWVCDGKSIFQYRHHEEQLVETPIPPSMQGQRIVDGPLPFLFGAEAARLKERYWFAVAKELTNQTYIGIHAKPKLQEDAANYTDVWVVLRNVQGKPLVPAGIRVRHPGGSWDEYRFLLNDAQVNARLPQIFGTLFQTPRTPFGWKKIVEPMQQAQLPDESTKK